MKNMPQYDFGWLNKIKCILKDCGLCYIWDSQTTHSVEWLKNTVQTNNTDRFIQQWFSDIEISSKCLNYRIFKNQFGFEPYLIHLPDHLKIALTRFRCRNHKLPIELGIYKDIARCNRLCKYCNVVGDEYHYIFECNQFNAQRNMYLKNIFPKKTINL